MWFHKDKPGATSVVVPTILILRRRGVLAVRVYVEQDMEVGSLGAHKYVIWGYDPSWRFAWSVDLLAGLMPGSLFENIILETRSSGL